MWFTYLKLGGILHIFIIVIFHMHEFCMLKLSWTTEFPSKESNKINKEKINWYLYGWVLILRKSRLNRADDWHSGLSAMFKFSYGMIWGDVSHSQSSYNIKNQRDSKTSSLHSQYFVILLLFALIILFLFILFFC